MRNTYILLFCFLALSSVKAQNLTPTVVSSSGNSYNNGGVNMDYTLGEIVIETFLPPATPLPLVYNILTQGFHQEILYIHTEVIELEIVSKVYPNPTTSILIVELEQNVTADLLVYDINGRLVLEDKLQDEQSKQLDFSFLKQGNYLLHINIAEKQSVYKIQKIK